MNSSYCVYRHTAPTGRVYVGMTSGDPERRWKGGFGYADNTPFFVDIVTYGWENFKHEILLTTLSEQAARAEEVRLIGEYKSYSPEYGYNRRGTVSASMSDGFVPGGYYSHPLSRPVRCVETGIVYPSFFAASRAVGTDRASIRRAVRRGYVCRGYHWVAEEADKEST